MISVGTSKIKIDVSWATLAKIGLALAIGYGAYLAREVLLLALSGLIISTLFNPAIDFLTRFGIARGAAVFMVYVSIFGALGAVIYFIAPLFIVETQQLGQLFPVYFEKVAPFLSGLGFAVFQSMDAFVAAIRDWLAGASSSIIGSMAAVFGGIFAMFIVITAAVFFSLEQEGIKKSVALLAAKNREKSALEWWQRAQIKVSGWFAVKLIAMTAVGVSTSLACWALDIRYPIFLGFFAGIIDIVPFIGPIISTIVLVLVALIDSWEKAISIVVIFTIIQQLESNLIIPMLAKKFIEFPAILVLISLLVGEALWGFAGAILAIPVFGIFYDFARDYLVKQKGLKIPN